MFYSIIKIINRLISKEMSKIYLNVTIKKNWPFQNFDLLSLKICFHVSFWRAPTHADIIQFQNFLLQPKNQSSESKTMCGFCFDVERNHGDFKSKKPCILLNKNINFNENETKWKWKIPYTVLERWTLCFSSCENHKLKVKLWWVRFP